MIPMKNMLLFGIGVLASVAMTQAEQKLGTGVTLTDATSIADVVKNPEAFVGKTIRIDGTATAVCQHMGCWMAVANSDKADAPTVRLKVEDGVIVFPVTAKGKTVSAQGVFEKIAPAAAEAKAAPSEHAKHEAVTHGAHQGTGHADHKAKPVAASAKYQLKATGAIIR